MDSLARFHAHWWEHPWLETDIGKLSNGDIADEEILGLPHSMRETEEMFANFVDFLGDRLSIARRRLYERVLSSWPFPRLSERLNERRGITLIHRDAHAWNFLYPRDPEHDRVCIIDWHEWGISFGINDLTELIVLWWYPERRARMEEALLRRYHHRLVEYGVEDYDWEQCWHDYRLCAIRILLYPVWMHAEGRSPTTWWPILERASLAFQDLECANLLE
jgi:Ser/Thr protein kinase RdoA (MazF antagonist)